MYLFFPPDIEQLMQIEVRDTPTPTVGEGQDNPFPIMVRKLLVLNCNKE